jgi:Tfp pilus assembly protein PilF
MRTLNQIRRRTALVLTSLIVIFNLFINGAAASAQTANTTATALLNEGYQHLRQNDYERAIASFKRAVAADPTNGRARLDLAYTLLTVGRDGEAIESFKAAVQLDPDNIQVRSQLGYLYIQHGRTRDALQEFLVVEKLDPTNYQVKNQLGFLYDKLGDKEQAREMFTEALASTDEQITDKARQALSNLSPAQTSRAGTIVSEFYAAPFYQSRFNNVIAPLIIRNGIVLETSRRVEAYTSIRFTHDSRSVGGSAPQIYSDNFVVTGLGLRARPFKNSNLTVYGEAGVATNLQRSVVASVKARSDFRAGVYWTRDWGEAADSDGLTAPMDLIGDLYFDASYYSRFRNNFIGYVQAREGLRFLHWNKTSFDVYGRGALVKDTGRDFYNNLAEGGGGLRLTPYRPLGLSISAEYVRGFYFGIERRGEPNPYSRQYNDFRVMLTFNKYFAKER